jgi:hypothetical protein
MREVTDDKLTEPIGPRDLAEPGFPGLEVFSRNHLDNGIGKTGQIRSGKNPT